MLEKIGAFLGTKIGTAAVVALTLATYFASEAVGTYLLSVFAILLTQAILVAGSWRDKAMHAKLDELIRAIPQADNDLRHLEEKPDALSPMRPEGDS